MESTPTGDGGIVREAREGHLERLSRELDTARPELIVTLGNAALRALRLLVEIDSGDPGPALAKARYGAEVQARFGARPIRRLPLVHPRSGERIPKWRQIHLRWVESAATPAPSRIHTPGLLTSAAEKFAVMAPSADARPNADNLTPPARTGGVKESMFRRVPLYVNSAAVPVSCLMVMPGP